MSLEKIMPYLYPLVVLFIAIAGVGWFIRWRKFLKSNVRGGKVYIIFLILGTISLGVILIFLIYIISVISR